MEERAVLAGHGAAPVLQRIQKLLAGRFDDAEPVAKGIHAHDRRDGHLALRDALSDAAAVGDGHVRAHPIAEGVRAEIAQVRLRHADDAHRRAAVVHRHGIVDGQLHVGRADHLGQAFVDARGLLLHQAAQLIVDAKQHRRGNVVVPGVQAGVDAAVRG